MFLVFSLVYTTDTAISNVQLHEFSHRKHMCTTTQVKTENFYQHPRNSFPVLNHPTLHDRKYYDDFISINHLCLFFNIYKEIIVCTFFVWLLLLNVIFVRFTHIVIKEQQFAFFRCHIVFFRVNIHNLFIHSITGGYLGFFEFGGHSK